MMHHLHMVHDDLGLLTTLSSEFSIHGLIVS